MKTQKAALLVFFLYFLVSLLFTWPLVTRIPTHGFGHDEDSPYHIWHNWWFKYSIFDLKQNPLHTNYIFHPQNINLIYDANAFVFSALTLPIQFLTNNVVLASNIIFLISFALSGLFAYLLANYILKNKPLAFICGFIFAFNPYVLAQAVDGHTNLTTTWMIPLYTLLLLKSLSSINIGEKFQISNFKFQIAAGIIAAAQFYNDFTYISFMIVETVLIYVFFLYKSFLTENKIENLKRFTASGFIIGTVVLLLGSPILYEVFKASREGFRAGSPAWVQNVWSADLLTFIRPNDQTTFLKNPWTPQIGTVEGTAFLGYTVIVLVLLYLVLRVVKKTERSSEENLVFFLSMAFFLLMLGPSLHYQNNFQFSILNSQFIFPLPYLLLHKIPFVGETQEPGRMFPFFILPLSILIGYALKKLLKSFEQKKTYLLFVICFLSFVTFEYLPLPFPTTDLSSKPIFDIIRKDPENKSVLVLPLGFNSGNYALGDSPIGSLQFYQIYFQKPSFRGTVARLPYSTFEYYQNLPVVPYLIDSGRSNFHISVQNMGEAQRVFRKQLNIKYIVVIENKYRRSMGQTYDIIEKVLNGKKFYESFGIRGYELQ